MKKSRRTYNGVHLNKKSNTQDVVEQSLTFKKPMTDLLAIIQNGNGNIKLEVTGEDLLLFSNQLISRAKHELSTAIAEARKEKYLTKEEVKTMCGVCDTTLWHWSKKNYLKPVKVGNKVRYRQSDIQRILGEHNPLI